MVDLCFWISLATIGSGVIAILLKTHFSSKVLEERRHEFDATIRSEELLKIWNRCDSPERKLVRLSILGYDATEIDD